MSSETKDLLEFRKQLVELMKANAPTAQKDQVARVNDAMADLDGRNPEEAFRHSVAAGRDEFPSGERTTQAGSIEREGEFLPAVPESLSELGIRSADIKAIVLKFLFNSGARSGLEIAKQIRLPLPLFAPLLRNLKEDQLVIYKSAIGAADYIYELTESGSERAHRFWKQCAYLDSIPVPFDDYVASVSVQSARKQNPKVRDLKAALEDLSIKEEMIVQLAQAANSGLGLFLYGAPGNGKTSIARRITAAFGQSVWIPRTINIAGSIVRLYDPNNHEALPLNTESTGYSGRIDERWVRIRRPTIVVGGELTMDNLEIHVNQVTAVSEAPIQMKSNCGTLVIDDFGRQRVSPTELLNRWIVPLERHYDILNLANGSRVDVPFDQLLVFSTNLEPRELVDEAFLRRIPYKIDVKNPSEDELRGLVEKLSSDLGIEYREGPVDYLIEKYYAGPKREMRYCHPRDILHQVRTYCTVLDLPKKITNAAIDAAANNYFDLL